MPRLTKAVPKYQKHRASGQAVVRLSGQDFYLGPHGTRASKLEYDRVICEWLANGRRLSAPPENGGVAVIELIARYWEFARGYYQKGGKPTSSLNSLKDALRPVKQLYGRTQAAEFGPLALRAVQKAMMADGVVRGTVNKRVGAIKRMFRWAVARELVPPELAHGLQAVENLKQGRTEARDNSPVQPVPEADVQTTLPHLPVVVADMVRFQRLVGCRPEEVCIVRPCDVDRSGDVWVYRPESHKTEHHGRERLIFIGPKAQAILRPYLLRESETYCFSPAESERKRRTERSAARRVPLKYGNRPGTNRKAKPRRTPRDRYDSNSYRRAIHRACDKAGVERWAPNRLRHSAGTEIRRLFGIEAAQVTLGHASADVTQVYAERDAELARRVAREVG
jgi:integrase